MLVPLEVEIGADIFGYTWFRPTIQPGFRSEVQNAHVITDAVTFKEKLHQPSAFIRAAARALHFGALVYILELCRSA
jgi:hypothetical protein